MTDAAFIFALCLGAAILTGMLVISTVTARRLERDRRPVLTPAARATPEEVHAAGEDPFDSSMDVKATDQRTAAPRIPETAI